MRSGKTGNIPAAGTEKRLGCEESFLSIVAARDIVYLMLSDRELRTGQEW